ncbi:MAG TPA: DUF2293 domain-containing protein, partial [Longimicrobium sp.]|nr:DUF2293 domain-containing protein [Longimicrobium sp.]
ACAVGTGRIGRSSEAKQLDADAVHLAVRAHVRHAHTDYDELLASGLERAGARERVRDAVNRVFGDWRGAAGQ